MRKTFLRTLHLGISSLLALALVVPGVSRAQTADDDMLLFIPPIIAGTTPLAKVKKLRGRWYFRTPGDDSVFRHYFRFDSATARESSNPDIALIDGSSSLFVDFSPPEWCDGGMIGSYSRQYREYLILCNWGYPNIDVGDAFFFDTLGGTFPTTHYYYIPSTGKFATRVASEGTGKKLSATYRAANAGANVDMETMEQQRLADYQSRLAGQLDQSNPRRVAQDAGRAAWVKAVSVGE